MEVYSLLVSRRIPTVTTHPNPPRRTRADLLELQLACQTVDLSPEQLDFIPSTLIKKTIRRKRGSRGGIRNRIRRRGSKLVARAARIVAAAPLEICEIEIECLSVRRPTNIVYDRETILNIRTLQASNITGIRWHLDILRKHRILTDTVTLCPQLPGGGSSRDGVDVNKTKHIKTKRKLKRGKRAGIKARLKTKPTRPAVPTILLSNVRSLENKLDELRLMRGSLKVWRDCCLFIFTESWLHENIPDEAVQLEGTTLFRADRDAASSGKSRGGGLCIYINKDWCVNAASVAQHCSELVEFSIVICRPFYLPREFTSVIVVAVYIAPCANANAYEVLRPLFDVISALLTKHPDSFVVVAGDFNHISLKTVLPGFKQYVDFKTRGENILDLVYSNTAEAYKAIPQPHIGLSDHKSVLLVPTYKPRLIRTRATQSHIRVWPDGAVSALQDCFKCTNWEIFKTAASQGEHHINIEEYAETVMSYIAKCTEDVTVMKTYIVRNNQKPWMTAEVRQLLKARDAAYSGGDKAALCSARSALSRGIRAAKRRHAGIIKENLCSTGNTRQMWQGVQQITQYKTRQRIEDSDVSLPDRLNDFFARFEAPGGPTRGGTGLSPPSGQTPVVISPADTRRTLAKINPRKAAGPDNVPGRALQACADELTDVLTDIFNISLCQATVPRCFKTSIIVPVAKKSVVSCLNDYRPVALTPIVMKCFERLIKPHITSSLPASLDPHQYAYRSNRSTEDAISTTLHTVLTHLEQRDNYARILYVDFSSAFNTILPQRLMDKLLLLGLNPTLCHWILDFLLERPQSVRVGKKISKSITLSTGSPQGCVLSPLLYTLLTHDCVPRHKNNMIVKFADDTTVVGLIHGNEESYYREEVNLFERWCRDNNLVLNAEKTKEMIVDFRRSKPKHTPLCISNREVEKVENIKFLGVQISDNLSWFKNTTGLVKRAQQRLYFLRKLHQASLPPSILTTFYRGAVESVLTYAISTWFSSCSAADKKALQRVVRSAEKVIGASLPSVQDIFQSRCRNRAQKIVRDPSHPLNNFFKLLPSKKRYRSLRCSTTRLRNSFLPQAVRMLNAPAS